MAIFFLLLLTSFQELELNIYCLAKYFFLQAIGSLLCVVDAFLHTASLDTSYNVLPIYTGRRPKKNSAEEVCCHFSKHRELI